MSDGSGHPGNVERCLVTGAIACRASESEGRCATLPAAHVPQGGAMHELRASGHRELPGPPENAGILQGPDSPYRVHGLAPRTEHKAHDAAAARGALRPCQQRHHTGVPVQPSSSRCRRAAARQECGHLHVYSKRQEPVLHNPHSSGVQPQLPESAASLAPALWQRLQGKATYFQFQRHVLYQLYSITYD